MYLICVLVLDEMKLVKATIDSTFYRSIPTETLRIPLLKVKDALLSHDVIFWASDNNNNNTN